VSGSGGAGEKPTYSTKGGRGKGEDLAIVKGQCHVRVNGNRMLRKMKGGCIS